MKYLNRINELNHMFDSILIFLGVLIPAFFTYHLGLKRHKREIIKQKEKFEIEKSKLIAENTELTHQKAEADIKMTFFNQIIDLTSINIISSSVDRMFEKTKADRFLIMIAVNGKTDFNVISVVFEQHKDKSNRINAIARYHNISIDYHYKKLLQDAEKHDLIDIHTSKMPESILKDFYLDEKVTESLIRKLIRKPIDANNDFLVYSSISTHKNRQFTRIEKSYIKTQYEGTIIPNIEKVLSNKQ